MRLYDTHILPNLVHFACSLRPAMEQRAKIVPLARGLVLEIGIGSGLNLPYYAAEKITKLWGLDPSPAMLGKAEARAHRVRFEIEFLAGQGEEIPLATGSVDTVVITYTLCSIVGVEQALQEMVRVLRPGGQLLFCEHGVAPDVRVRRWQERINPIWKSLGGGCHLNRDIPSLIEQGGFRVEALRAGYISGWRPATYNYWGVATPCHPQ